MKKIRIVLVYCIIVAFIPSTLLAGNDTWTSINGPPGGNCMAVDFAPPRNLI